MRLDDLIDCDLLERMLEERFVSETKHPTEPLAILNYTQRTQFDRVWNPVTRQCRGLIYNFETGDVIARPWPKFFNYGELIEVAGSESAGDPPYEIGLDPTARIIVTDKLDGSLGIIYPVGGHEAPPRRLAGFAVATRGSFTSDQALHATQVWGERYAAKLWPRHDWTYLVEIVYPENRIVVDYDGLDDLILLAVLDTATGRPVEEEVYWPGPIAETFAYEMLAEALEAEPRSNCEGLVVYFPDTDERLKLKQEDYVALHRIVTGLNERTVWEHLGAGGTIDELLEPLPEEFRPWVSEVETRLTTEAGLIFYRARIAFDALYRSSLEVIADGAYPDEFEARSALRKYFASYANESEYRPYLFLLLDGKDPMPAIWKTLRPSYPKTLVDVSEAVA